MKFQTRIQLSFAKRAGMVDMLRILLSGSGLRMGGGIMRRVRWRIVIVVVPMNFEVLWIIICLYMYVVIYAVRVIDADHPSQLFHVSHQSA